MKRSDSGFTVFELLTIVVVVAILVVLAFPAIAKLRARAQRAQCSSNLRALYVGAELYLQDKGSWPQISRSDSDDGPQFANSWIEALTPFGVVHKTWICPTIENILQNPGNTSSETARVDYIATPFDDKPGTPHLWPRQPWFVERADVHGNGNLIIFTDGSIGDLHTVLAEAEP